MKEVRESQKELNEYQESIARDDLREQRKHAIEKAKTQEGGWSKETLQKWGVPWPPPKGWKKKLTSGS